LITIKFLQYVIYHNYNVIKYVENSFLQIELQISKKM